MQKYLTQSALIQKFRNLFGAMPEIMVKAAGRVNLIGEHTDYNDGYVLPASIDRYIFFVARKREDSTVKAYASDFQNMALFDISDGERDEKHPWTIYMKGVMQLLQKKKFKLGGVDILIAANLPRASGLSSSAAMEVGTASLLQILYPFHMEEIDIIKLTQKAENQYAGTQCGIMDMFVCRLGEKDHALFLDCRTLKYESVPIDFGDVSIVICDSRKKRGLVESAYNERRSQCEQGVELLKQWQPDITALRDVSVELLKEHAAELPDDVRQRCEHVVYENERVLQSVKALRKKDIKKFGKLMAASHESLRDLYEVSCPELDTLVEAANEVEGTFGSRMTGAGFGGCTVNLVQNDALEEFKEHVVKRFTKTYGMNPTIHACNAENGIEIIPLKRDTY